MSVFGRPEVTLCENPVTNQLNIQIKKLSNYQHAGLSFRGLWPRKTIARRAMSRKAIARRAMTSRIIAQRAIGN